MLFVDDDDAEIFKWGKQRGAGADHNGRFAIFRLQPAERRSLSLSPECSTSTGALKRWRNRAMVCGVRPISGTITSAGALRQHILQHAQIDFRFPGAGNTRQQPAEKRSAALWIAPTAVACSVFRRRRSPATEYALRQSVRAGASQASSASPLPRSAPLH